MRSRSPLFDSGEGLEKGNDAYGKSLKKISIIFAKMMYIMINILYNIINGTKSKAFISQILPHNANIISSM